MVDNHIFFVPLHPSPPLTFGMGKLEWCGYPTLKKVRGGAYLAVSAQYQRATDRQTSYHNIVCAMHSIAW